MNGDQRDLELLELRTATTAYSAVIRNVEHWLGRSDVRNRSSAARLEVLRRQLETAQRRDVDGTPAAIGYALGQLLGER